MRIGVDLLWVRPGKCGGTESYIRNLLDGFAREGKEKEYVLFVARDNAESFQEYEKYEHMTLHICAVDCAVQMKRILWENLHLDRMAKKTGVDVMFIPVYSKPHTFGSKLPYVCVIHDLQALHYPQYFSGLRRCFLKATWKYACRTATRVITDSDFCKKDLEEKYPCVREKIQTIYVPIISKDTSFDFAMIKEKYAIEKGDYFYCVSSLLPHKNLNTLLQVMAAYKAAGAEKKLIISGVGGEEEEFLHLCEELGIDTCVTQTGFVSDAERDCLYENCKLFLFPSIFEGFGMPPIEAMRKGKHVVMTKKSCLEEITCGKAVYVEDPVNVEEWIEKIEQAEALPEKQEAFAQYELKHIVEQYQAMFEEINKWYL